MHVISFFTYDVQILVHKQVLYMCFHEKLNSFHLVKQSVNKQEQNLEWIRFMEKGSFSRLNVQLW